MQKLLPLIPAVALALGACASQGGTKTQVLPAFEQVDRNGDGQIEPQESNDARLSIDWVQADKLGRGSLTKNEYDWAVRNGYVHQTGHSPATDPSLGPQETPPPP